MRGRWGRRGRRAEGIAQRNSESRCWFRYVLDMYLTAFDSRTDGVVVAIGLPAKFVEE